jgi:hypothetical protein
MELEQNLHFAICLTNQVALMFCRILIGYSPPLAIVGPFSPACRSCTSHATRSLLACACYSLPLFAPHIRMPAHILLMLLLACCCLHTACCMLVCACAYWCAWMWGPPPHTRTSSVCARFPRVLMKIHATWSICFKIRLKKVKYLKHKLATYVYSHCNICNI